MSKFALALVALVSATASTAARADGFTCQTLNGDLRIKLYNNTDSNDGTRVGSVMVLSDPAIRYGRKTIARFSDVNATLTNVGASYEASVDLRFNDSGRQGELISGTKLGQLQTIAVDVDFSYADPIADGEQVTGKLTLVKRGGSEIARKLVCARYLKN